VCVCVCGRERVADPDRCPFFVGFHSPFLLLNE